MFQRFSIGFKSGDCAGQDILFISFIPLHLVVLVLYKNNSQLLFISYGISNHDGSSATFEGWRQAFFVVFFQRLAPNSGLWGQLLLWPHYWQTFWSLNMPPKAFTPWLRLLHDHITTPDLQHIWNSYLIIFPLHMLFQKRYWNTLPPLCKLLSQA